MRRYLVVANQTLGGDPLLALLRGFAEEPSTFHVLVPASPPVDHLWTEAEAISIARTRLETALERFRSVGIEATGEVGDGRPLQAIDDVLARDTFDGIVLSTLPASVVEVVAARSRAPRPDLFRPAGPPRDLAARDGRRLNERSGINAARTGSGSRARCCVRDARPRGA